VKPFTTGTLRWVSGISFATVSKEMVAFFQKSEVQFDRHHGKLGRGGGGFQISREGQDGFEYSDEPWRDDPMLKPGFLRARWSLWDAEGSHWLSFACHLVDDPPTSSVNLPTKVFVISFGFEGLLYTRTTMTTAEFDRAVKKYHLLKDLFHDLGCDELTGVDGNAADPLNPRYSDPTYGGWCFRFSRVNKQVLIRALEERQMPPPNCSPEFVFIDPAQLACAVRRQKPIESMG